MEYKEATAILLKMLDKYKLDAKEKEAILSAIGVLDMGSIAKKILKRRIEAIKAKRAKSIED